MERSEWIWMPHAAHYVQSHLCTFQLATYVGGYIVSTLGDQMNRQRLCAGEVSGIFETLSSDFKYETYVWHAVPNEDNDCGCPYVPIIEGSGVEGKYHLTALEAVAYHNEMCEKYSHE